jgi:GTP cyclohydrolase I
MVSAKHLCACLRGVKHPHSAMKTSKLSGAFRDGDYSVRQEFYNFVKDMK